MRDTIEMAREAGFESNGSMVVVRHSSTGSWVGVTKEIERLIAMARADERMSFYGQDKPVECAEGCPPNQICDYCQVVAPVKAMILAEREACARICETEWSTTQEHVHGLALADMIRARGETK